MKVWSNALEIALAMYLLERQLGVACVIPIGVAIGKLLYLSHQNDLLKSLSFAARLSRSNKFSHEASGTLA
jgi:hypothetical protein